MMKDIPQSNWINEAKRRKRWRWLTIPVFKIKVKYHILKRRLNERF